MLDIEQISNQSISFWERQPTDQPWLVNGFKGTWAFSDHSRIPESLHNFIIESFPKVEKFKRIPIEDINALMNDVWEGPGSMVKIEKLVKEFRIARQRGLNPKSVKMDDVKTIDDYTESDFRPSLEGADNDD